MTSHRPPPHVRTPLLVWVIAAGAAIGIVGPPVVALAQTVAPQVAAQTALAFPEQTPEPMGHGGIGPLVIPSIGVVATGTATAETPSVTSGNPVSAPRTPVAPRSGLSGGLTRAPSASTGLSEAATGTPVETTTPPTTTEAAQTTTEPEPTDTSEPTTEPSTTASGTTTTATTEETDVTGTSTSEEAP